MPRRFLLVLVLLAWSAPAAAQQIIESAGSRALGMGGAFVGVADDATGVYWNPAGLASGPPAGMTIGWVDFRSGDQDGPPAPGPARRSSKFVSLGTWPIGVSYGTFRDTALTRASDGTTRADTFQMSEIGATILQTVTPGLVIGSTVRYERGRVISAPADGHSAGEVLSATADLEGPNTGHFDLDVGAMADFQHLRVGVLVRNLRQPTFGDVAETAITLQRQARLGLAVLPTRGLTLAMDMDLDTVDLRDGPRRILAVGGEYRSSRWALRSGVRWNLKGDDRRPVAAVGASVLLRPHFWLDTHYSGGNLDVERGVGVALRAGF